MNIIKGGKYSLIAVITFLIFTAAFLSADAFAVQPVVKTVPWVASNPLIPHDTWSGKQITLKGTANVQGGNFQYAWDFGDGSPVVTGTVVNKNQIEALHIYTGNTDDIYTARLTVVDTSTGETDSEEYYVQIRDKTLAIEVNVAIDEGLWYLHKSRIDISCGSYACSYWSNTSYGTYGQVNYAAVAASSINAFEANGHLESGNPDNPYVKTVQRGMRYLLSTLVSENIYNQPAGNPDSNGNGIGIRPYGSSRYPYASGAVMDAIITSGTPDAVAVTGRTYIVGRTYGDIVQDMVDSYAYGQYDSGPARGGWRYYWNTHPDNSAAQWGAIGMIPAEREWGLIVPNWVKTENLIWLNYSQYYSGYESSWYYGGFGYTGKGYGTARTASGLVQLAFDGVSSTHGRWKAAEKLLRDRWSTMFARGADYYAMFAFAKAMRLANPEPVVEFGSSSSAGALDWYNDPVQGFARKLVDKQNSNGSWSGGNRSYINYRLATPWSVLILSKTLFDTGGPVAVAEALPNPGVVGQTIILDGSDSFHQDAGRSIDSWEWDLDNDGQFNDAAGPFTSISFSAIGNYVIGLRVSDDGIGEDELKDQTTITVRITTPPIAPTADAGGPYVFCPQAQPWFLDGTGSSNPDEGESQPGFPGDTIQEYGWELDGLDNDFNEASGQQPDVTALLSAMGEGNYLIQLRVTDTTASSFPSSGYGDLSDTDSAHVFVMSGQDPVCSCIDDLVARAKTGKVQLVWSDTGADHYNVYRGTTSGGPYSLIASTDSTYSTYLDYSVINGTTYFYVVRPAALNDDEYCQSNEASATPPAERRRRR